MSTHDDGLEDVGGPAPETGGSRLPRPRLLAVTAAGHPVTRTFARLVDALRAEGAEVRALAVPATAPRDTGRSAPSLTELKAGLHALADQMQAALRGSGSGGQPEPEWLQSLLQTVDGTVDGVVAIDPSVAASVFQVADRVWPSAVRVAVDGDYHVDGEWHGVEFDDLVTPHPALGTEVSRVAERRARLRSGGPIVAPANVEGRVLKDGRGTVVVSFARLDASEVDPLLFQLSLARPERFDVLFLPSGRAGIDELVRSRAAGYGLQGKRPKTGSDSAPWIRGASLLLGHPSPNEAATAVDAAVPQVLFIPEGKLDTGDAFYVQHGLALHATTALTVAVQIDAAMPGGASRAELDAALAQLESDGPAGAAAAVVAATRAGRPRIEEVQTETVEGLAGGADDELEDIGGSSTSGRASSAPFLQMDDRVKRAYLTEVILQLKDLGKQIARAEAGLDTWANRLRVAHGRDPRLEREAGMRVEGIKRVLQRLTQQRKELHLLRERLAGRGKLTREDHATVRRYMSPDAAATVDRMGRDATGAEFTMLEVEDALRRLKDRLDDFGD